MASGHSMLNKYKKHLKNKKAKEENVFLI